MNRDELKRALERVMGAIAQLDKARSAHLVKERFIPHSNEWEFYRAMYDLLTLLADRL